MKRALLCLLLAAGVTASAAAQTVQRDSLFLGLPRKTVATYTTIAWSAAAVALEFEWWWRPSGTIYKQHVFRFHGDGYFFNDHYGVDKLGHAYSSYLIFHLTYDFMQWASIDEDAALWTAVAVPAAHAIAIELGDGFSKYAFNGSDLVFNSSGLLYGLLQVKYPYLNNFNYKWSYYPSPSRGSGDPDWGPASDYSGHIYWMSMDVHNLLPEKAQPYWPKELNLALGLGARNVSFGDTGPMKHKFAIALDWNTNAILPDGDTFQIFKNLVNKIHWPAPGVEIYTGEPVKGKLLLLN